MDKDSYNKGSIMDSLELTGVSIMHAMVILVNFKIITSTYQHDFGSVFWQLGSVSMFYIAFFTFSRWEWFVTEELFGIFRLLMTYITNYFLLVLFFIGYVLVDAGVEGINRLIESRQEQEEKEKELEI